MAYQVEKFLLGWHPQTGGAYRLKIVGGAWTNWINVPSADLSALAAIFAEQPVYIHPNGSITTGEEPIGS
ncbi:MAG: hypothetical protein KA945_11735 [Zoogloea sp.]|nr:hypothetical protein [Zoogloea sp.]